MIEEKKVKRSKNESETGIQSAEGNKRVEKYNTEKNR